MTDSAINESLSNRFLALVQDEKLRREFLPPMSHSQVKAIGDCLQPVLDEVAPWLGQFSMLKPAALLPVAVFKICQLPQLAPQDIATAVKWEIWVLALDDLFDHRQLPLNGIMEIAEECCRVSAATPGTEQPKSELGESFRRIKMELAGHSLFRKLQPTFVGTLTGLIDGMMYCYAMSPASETGKQEHLPSLDEYLYHAARTAVHPYMWSLALYDDETVLPALARLSELASQCSRALRLANDLSSHKREEREGVLNAIAIKKHEHSRALPSLSPEQVLARVIKQIEKRMERERRKAREFATSISTQSHVESHFLQALELASAMFRVHDVREWDVHLDALQAAARIPA